MGSDLKGVIGCESTRSDSAVKLVSCYVPRGEVRRPFSYFVPSRRVILDNKPFTLNEACVAKQEVRQDITFVECRIKFKIF